MTQPETPLRIGILWRGEAGVPPPPAAENRLHAIFEAFAVRGAEPVGIAFAEEGIEEITRQVGALDAVLTWVDPIVRGRDRSSLDAMLRDAAKSGVYVSAHPDVILAMGTKDVLVQTKDMGWGSDCHIARSADELAAELPPRLRAGPRVLKQHRGSTGNGVWKVELVEDGASAASMRVGVLHALRGSSPETLFLAEFIERCRPYFDAFGGAGCMIDQPYQPRLGEGMIRCYMAGNRVVGFGHQFVTALLPLPEGANESPAPPPRYYFGPDKAEFQGLKSKLEGGWIAEMCGICGVAEAGLPVIWDADFLLGPALADGSDTYVLCEINVSGVFPIPDESVGPLAELAIERAGEARKRRAQSDS